MQTQRDDKAVRRVKPVEEKAVEVVPYEVQEASAAIGGNRTMAEEAG